MLLAMSALPHFGLSPLGSGMFLPPFEYAVDIDYFVFIFIFSQQLERVHHRFRNEDLDTGIPNYS